ncbi:MAG: hypothetical protein VX899_08160 [Myxococcota bacterium]|nr:hypothetical protein [Myxococcota bacterium]
MGLLSWLFPSDGDRLRKAEKLLAGQEWAAARDEVMGVEGEQAEALRRKALDGLMHKNIELAILCAESGETEQSRLHMELATEFAAKGDPAIRAARRQLRELRTGSKQSAPKAPAPSLGGGGGGVLGSMGIQVATPEMLAGSPALGGAEGDDPIFSLPPSDPRVRFALMLERYGEQVADRLQALGPDFATAVLSSEEGEPAHAYDVLGRFVEREPLARWFRAQAALLANKPAEGVVELEALHKAEGGFVELAGQHSAAVLAGALMQLGHVKRAAKVLDQALEKEPTHLALQVNKALVLEALGQDAEADNLARRIIKQSSRVMEMYKLMGRARVRQGKRLEAMQALEAGLTTNCSSGKCGSLPFDVQAGRQLAQLYLEDRLEPARAADLVSQIHRNIGQPGWFEAYLETLTARNAGAADLRERVGALKVGLRPEDPRLKLVDQAFAPQLGGA